MCAKILVCYASRSGATAGVAEEIGKSLAESGFDMEVCPMDEVKDVSPYRAVVAGSAIQAGRWLPEAMQFMNKFKNDLSSRPVAVFLVCMTLAMPKAEEYRTHVSNWLQPVRTLIKPVSEGLFAGTLEIKRIHSFTDRIKFRLSVLFGVWKEGDHRKWNEIRDWTSQLAGRL